MTRELHCLRYGEQEIQYEIVRRPRKTLEIAVEPRLQELLRVVASNSPQIDFLLGDAIPTRLIDDIVFL